MNIHFDTEANNDHTFLTKLEWLETNGLGGWASGTVSGTHSRRYHGLLVAALHPPVGRVVLVSKLVETLTTQAGVFELDSNNFNGIIHPTGFTFLREFNKNLFPEFYFQVGDVVLKKTIFMVNGDNTTVIQYEVVEGNEPLSLKLSPFVAARDYHWLSKANYDISYGYNFDKGLLSVKPYQNMPEIFIQVPQSEFHYSPDWYFNYNYNIEQERVQDYREDLFTYGDFKLNLVKGQVISVVISIEDPKKYKGINLLQEETKRKNALLLPSDKEDSFMQTLLLAADQFIVKRGDNLKTIIAGYHWFADWGRDTMISLPGLCLTTRRFEEAKKIIQAFAQVIDQGMIPNRFTDQGEEPEYNNVDGTLWYFVAIYQYILHTDDWGFIEKELYLKLSDIVDWHVKGTRFGIKVDEDGLLQAGEVGSQLTWMDAKVENWVVTPRVGKAVEINALWFNALKIMAFFAKKLNNENGEVKFEKMALKVKNAFSSTFLDVETDTLVDFVNDGVVNKDFRPNQIFVLSLPFELVNKNISKNIIKKVEESLLTARGLRSLSPFDVDYKAFYLGDQWSRDGAYHQGTVWSWLIGPYLSAKMKIQGKTSLPKVKKWFEEFEPHFKEAGIGQVSEIFDGTAPFAPKGCMAQAWGVAEILRAYVEFKALQRT